MVIVIRKDFDRLLLYMTNVLPYSRTEIIQMNYLQFFDALTEAKNIVKARELAGKKAKDISQK